MCIVGGTRHVFARNEYDDLEEHEKKKDDGEEESGGEDNNGNIVYNKSKYVFIGKKLAHVKEGKFLGVTTRTAFLGDLWQPQSHVRQTTSLGFLRRNLSSCPPSLKARSYTT
ncbi:hypothetical protein DPMN_084033 [Dreissena polymorpha]|uniref:Uncharacterized protein n=1 Tax=Dreissena polymorpha TaxID=45954 RepID=A0A9D3YA18_DREPO|nr:hypothetical protein DPMN_084033 [Dreissena polymorpha]